MPKLFLLVAAETADLGIWSLISHASAVVMGVMILLLLMSLFCWYIIGNKYFQVTRATRESDAFMRAFWSSGDIDELYGVAQKLQNSPLSHMFTAGYSELAKLQKTARRAEADLENVERALSKAMLEQRMSLEAATPFLATTGSAAPFIGLFGTVWGILLTFQTIGVSKKTGLDVLGPKIAEALIATAIGLVAAIPAVIAYNFFVRKIRVLTSEMETFSKDFLNIVRRNFLT